MFPETALADITSEGYCFTVVLSNVAGSHYADAIAGKPYIKVNGVYYYGVPVVRSLYEAAQALAADYAEGGVPAHIQDVLDAVEG